MYRPLVGNLEVSREAFGKLVIDARRSADAVAGGFSKASEGVRSISGTLAQARNAFAGFYVVGSLCAAVGGSLRQLRCAEGSLTLVLPGDTRLLVGHLVLITGLSEPVAGQRVIERAEHTLDAGGMKTRLECVPPGAPVRASKNTT